MEPVRHTRPQPEAWPELIDLAQHALPKHAIALYPGALQVARQTIELSDSELDQNNYYGMGKLMCGLAQQLQDPDIRESVTTRMAVGLVRQAYKKRDMPKKELYQPVVGDLSNDTPLALPFFDPTTDAWKELAPAERLLSAILSNTAMARRRIDVKFEPGSLKSKAWRRVQPHLLSLGAYMSSPVAAVAGNTTTGPTVLWQAHLLGNRPGDFLGPKQAATPIDMERVKALAERPGNFTITARLRQDEFAAGVGWSKSQPAEFDRSVLKQPPRKEIYPGTRLLPGRKERLGCEALFAGRLLVDIAADMIPTALEKATTLTPKEALQLHRDFLRAERA